MRKPHTAEIILRARVPKGMTARAFRHEVWNNGIAPQEIEVDNPDDPMGLPITLHVRPGPARIVRNAKPGADPVKTMRDALWSIAAFALNTSEAPEEGDHDDMDSAYSNGEDVSLWGDGKEALEALAKIGDRKAVRQLARVYRLEQERDERAEELFNT
jgi:hypothetical protein